MHSEPDKDEGGTYGGEEAVKGVNVSLYDIGASRLTFL